MLNIVLPTNRDLLDTVLGSYQDGVWKEGVLSKKLTQSSNDIVILNIDGKFDRALFKFLQKLIDNEFPIVLPTSTRVSLPVDSKILIETPRILEIEDCYLKDFSIQRMDHSNLQMNDVLKHLFLTHFDDVVYKKILKYSKQSLCSFQEFLQHYCSPLIQQDFTTSETNFFNSAVVCFRMPVQSNSYRRNSVSIWDHLNPEVSFTGI